MPEFVTRKLGPLPAWAWLLIGLGLALAVLLYLRNRGAGGVAGALAGSSGSDPAAGNPAAEQAAGNNENAILNAEQGALLALASWSEQNPTQGSGMPTSGAGSAGDRTSDQSPPNAPGARASDQSPPNDVSSNVAAASGGTPKPHTGIGLPRI